MSRWIKKDPYLYSASGIWSGALDYIQDDGGTWFAKVEMHGESEKQVKQLQGELLSFLQAQEICGVTHG